MKQVEERVFRLNHKADEVLVVFDIDNTVLTMNQDLGSDQWFMWQNAMIKKEQKDEGLVTKDFDTLLSIQYQLFETSRMRPPENRTPPMIRKLQEKGYRVIALSSRGYKSLRPTLRELKNNQMDFSKTALKINEQDTWLPYNLKDLKVISPQEAKSYQLQSNARKVIYQEGVFLTAGQHKGAMLRILLYKASFLPKAIFFVDDHLKHSDSVQQAFAGQELSLYSFRYSHEDQNVNSFIQGEGKELAKIQMQEIQQTCSKKQMGKLNSILKVIFGRDPVRPKDRMICELF